jgi:hypothetical protein
MNSSALESSIKTLEMSLDSLGFWLSVWTFLVVLGLVIEYWHDVRDLIVARPFNWKLFQTLVGGVLITVGVGGELYVQVKASRIEGQLRERNHQALANAAKEAEDERLARIGLEVLVAPRRLTIEQQRAIANSCHRFAGRTVVISSYALDTEAQVLSEQICSAFQAAGMHCVPNPGSLNTFGKLLQGIRVSGSRLQHDFVSAIKASLEQDGHLALAGLEQEIIPSVPGNRFEEFAVRTERPSDASIFVGVKPVVLLRQP